jgi:predicted TIM-barrel fold metal-dependent hydrolase
MALAFQKVINILPTKSEQAHQHQNRRKMQIIDAHIHTAFDSLLLKEAAKFSAVDYSLPGLKREMEEDGVQYAISMGMKSREDILLDQTTETPMLNHVNDNNVIAVGGINPCKSDRDALSRVENALSAGKIRGIKIYLGYFPKYAYDDIYKGFYELAAKYNIPVIFHTGDTYDKNARVKYAHPLTIDEVAVDFKDTKFVIAHIGNPWTIDAGEVIYKNHNVYGDLSGLFIGGEDQIDSISDRDLDNIIKAYRWVNNPYKFLYGSDWPIVSMKAYIKLIQRILRDSIPSENYLQHIERVFLLNTKDLFGIKS